jgi:hypothetical protein
VRGAAEGAGQRAVPAPNAVFGPDDSALDDGMGFDCAASQEDGLCYEPQVHSAVLHALVAPSLHGHPPPVSLQRGQLHMDAGVHVIIGGRNPFIYPQHSC